MITCAQAKQFLDSLSNLGMRFGLERMQTLLAALGNPQNNYRILHVAGTNGKGSTCAFAASILRAQGARVGLYTSPHLIRVNERVQINGCPIPDEMFARGIEAIARAGPGMDSTEPWVTYFEMCTLLALWYFAVERVEVAVLETGLGGRLDATNVVVPQVSALTRIGLDHTALLGETLAQIAREKAGIIKPDAPVVLGHQPPEALRELVDAARAVGQTPSIAGRDFVLEPEKSTASAGALNFRSGSLTINGLRLSLAGPHQVENAQTAIEAARLMMPGLEEAAIRAGLGNTQWPGRLETVALRPLTLLDGAHNPDGARALADAVRELYPQARVHLVFGVLADKDVTGIAQILLPIAQHAYLASPRCERALKADELAKISVNFKAPCSVFSGIGEALVAASAAALAQGDKALVLAAGSLYVVGEVKAFLQSTVEQESMLGL